MADTQDRLARTQERRALVPTDRERSLGARAQDGFRYERDEGPVERPPLRTRMAAYAQEIDPRRIPGDKRALYLLPIAGGLVVFDDQVIGLLGPEIRSDFNFSIEFLFTITLLLNFVSIVLAPFFGYMADRVNRLWMARIGGFIGNSGSILLGLSTGIPGLVFARVMGGFGAAIANPAGLPLLADYFPPRARARAYAYFGAVSRGFALISPPIVGVVATAYGWRASTVVFGVIAVAATGLLFFLREPVRGLHERLEMGADAETARREQEPMTWGESWRAAGSIVTVRRLWYATPFLYLGSTGTFLMFNFLIAEKFQADPAVRSLFGTTATVMALLAMLFASPIADRMLAQKPERIMVLYGAMLISTSVTVALVAISPNVWVALALFMPGNFVGVLFGPAQGALFSLTIPPRVRGLGLQTFIPWTLPGLIALPFFARAADNWGTETAMLALAPTLLIGGLFSASAATGVARDIRAAKAAALADEEARRAKAEGRTKMLICRDVDVTYDGTQVLFGVDLDVEEGEIIALLGTNGAGKSTLLRAILGLQEASNGAIFLDGEDITHAPPHQNARRGIVMVPGGQAVFPTLTVEENLRTAARLDPEGAEGRLDEVLDLFPRLRERYREQAGNLSGGEQQMLALGQAFLMRPRLLMIDELSLGLAPQVVEQLLDTVRRIHAAGTTVILVEQSVNVALTIAERAVFMEKGEVRFDGSTDDLLGRPDLVRSVFMGGAVSARTLGGRRALAAEREELLVVDDVSVRFGGVRALQGVSLDLSAGEVVGIIGPNGAGKTTLFDVISGLVRPDTGRVVLEGEDVTNLTPDARARLRLGRSFQNATLFPTMTVRDAVAVAMERRAAVRNPVLAAVWAPKVRDAERRVYQRVDALIEILGLEDFANKFVSELSTGSRRAVDIACIMAAQPRVLLLDEPSSGLAQAETEELGPVISRLVRETGCGVLVIEHDMPLITAVSDRLVAMELGAVIAAGKPADVVADPRVVSSYLSASEGVLARSGGGRLEELMRSGSKNDER